MSRLSRNIVYTFIGGGLLLGLSFVATKYVYHRLGDDVLGILSLVGVVGLIFTGVLDKGLSSTTIREVSTFCCSDPKYVREFVRTGATIYWGIYLAMAAVVYSGAPIIILKWVHLKSISAPTAVYLLRVLGTASLLAFPIAFYNNIIRALQRMAISNTIDVTAAGLQSLGVFVILKSGGNLSQVVCWLTGCYFLPVVAYVATIGHFLGPSSLIPACFPRVIHRNRSFFSKMSVISALALIQKSADKIILSKLLHIAELGYYWTASRLILRMNLFSSGIADASFPAMFERSTTGDCKNMKSQYFKLQDLLCVTSVPVYALIPFAFPVLFTYMFTPEIAARLFVPACLLSLGFFMNATLSLPYQFSLVVEKPEITIRSSAYSLCIVLPLTVFLVRTYGMTGASFSWICYNLFAYLYAVPRICRECLQISPALWYSHIFKVVAAGVIAYGGGWGILRASSSFAILPLALAYATASIVYIALAYLVIGRELRESLLQTVKAKLQHAR